MIRRMATSGSPTGAAFLLAQLGAHAASRFASRLGQRDLTPPQAGILRQLREGDGLSQQELADRLRIPASRVVAFVDDLEGRGLLRRERNPSDRRQNILRTTHSGRDALRAIGSVAREHEADLLAALDDDERRQLTALLERVAQQQGLTPGVHPGYRYLRTSSRTAADPEA